MLVLGVVGGGEGAFVARGLDGLAGEVVLWRHRLLVVLVHVGHDLHDAVVRAVTCAAPPDARPPTVVDGARASTATPG